MLVALELDDAARVAHGLAKRSNGLDAAQLLGEAAQEGKLWDLESGAELRTLQGHTDGVWAVAVTPDGKRAVSASADQTLKLWDLGSGAELRTLQGHTDGVRAVAVAPNGKRAVSASDDQTLNLWDLESGKFIATFSGDSAITACAAGPDSRTFVASESSARIHFLRLEGVD